MALFNGMSTQRNERSIYARLVTASLTGSQASLPAAIPEGFTQLTAALTALGIIVIVFRKPFQRVPCVQPTAQHVSASLSCTLAAVTTNGCTINVFTTSTAAATTPTALHLDITSWDSADQI